MGTAGGIVRNFAFAIRTLSGFLLRSFGRRRRGIDGPQAVNELDKHEDAQGNNEEVDDRLNEIANGKHRCIFPFAQGDGQRAEIDAAGQRGDDGRKQVIDKAGDDAGKCAADNHTNGHVDDIALEGKVLEFLDELVHENPLSVMAFDRRIQIVNPWHCQWELPKF